MCWAGTPAYPRKQRARYSNYGMGLLGHLLARAAGTSYEALIADRILEPLGMTDTSAGGADPVPGFRKGQPTAPWTFGALAGAGALRSTLADLITFSTACMDPPSGTLGTALDLARTPAHRGRFGIDSKGLGWNLRPTPGADLQERCGTTAAPTARPPSSPSTRDCARRWCRSGTSGRG